MDDLFEESAPATEDPSGQELNVDEDDGLDDASDIENEDDDEQL